MKISTAEAFNIKYPVGTPVCYWPVLPARDEYPPKETKTRSEAWDVAKGRAIVMVDGIAGGVAISHIELIK